MTGTYALTDVGRIRDTDEDAVLTAPVGGGRLLLVADGMGGHAAGDIAGDIASDAAATTVRERRKTADLDAANAESALASAIEAANADFGLASGPTTCRQRREPPWRQRSRPTARRRPQTSATVAPPTSMTRCSK